MISYIKSHKFFFYFLIPWSLVCAFLFDLKNYLIFFKVLLLGEKYNYFSFLHPDSLVAHAPVLRDIIDGHFLISDGRIFEYASSPNLWSPVISKIIAPILLLTESVDATMLIGRFLFVSITAIIAYYLTYHIVRDRYFSIMLSSIFATTTLIFNFFFIHSFENLKILIRSALWFGSPSGDVLLSRYSSFSVFPSLPFFVLAVFIIYLALSNKTARRSFIFFAATAVAFNTYILITNAIYLFACLFVIAILFAVYKKWCNFFRAVLIALFGFLFSAYYFYNYFIIRSLPHSDEFFRRIGGELTHDARWNFWPQYLSYIALSLFILWWGKRYNKINESVVISGFVLATIPVLNIQIITGFNPTPFAYYVHQFFIGFYIGWMVFLFWLYSLIKKTRYSRFSRVFLAVFAMLIISRSVNAQYYAYSHTNFHSHYTPDAIHESLVWLNKNTPIDSVVGTPSLVSNSIIPYQTHNRVYFPVAVTFPGPISEIVERFFVIYSLFNVSPDYFEKRLRAEPYEKIDDFALQHDDAIIQYLFDAYYNGTELNDSLRNRFRHIPESDVLQYVEQYKHYSDYKTVDELLKKNKLDYLYVGPYEKRFSSLKVAMNMLELVFDNGSVQIYKILK